MARERGGPLLAQLARLARLLEQSCGVEEDCSRVARGFEACRQRCCRLGLDLRRAREQLLAAESECSALRVKLKHARNQVEVEMGKRQRAEAELEKQERKLQLIFDFLMQESPRAALSEGQRSALVLLEGPQLGTALAPGRRLSAVDESCTSLTSHSDISYDRTEDDVDLDLMVVKPLKQKSRERPRSSLAPLIGPVVAAKRTRPPVLPAAGASEPLVTLSAGPVAEDRGLDRSRLPVAAVPMLGRRSHLGRRLSTLTELTTVWGSSEDSDSHPESGAGLEPRGLDPFPSPPQGLPPPQHLFTSKTVIRPEPCAGCGARARFGRVVLRCKQCLLLAHPECRGRCPPLCAPGPRPQPRQGVLADFAPPTAPLVPALVVHCVSEVERRGLTETGLYRVPGAEPLVREWRQKLLRAKGGAALAGPRGRRARGVWGAQGLPEGPRGAAGHLPPAPRLPAGRRDPGRGRLPGSPVPRGEQTAPRQPGHAGLPNAASAEGRSEPRVQDGRTEPGPGLRAHAGGARHEQPHAPGHPAGHAPAVRGDGSSPVAAARVLEALRGDGAGEPGARGHERPPGAGQTGAALPPPLVPRDELDSAEPDWRLLPRPAAELHGHRARPPAGVGPQEDGPVLPLPAV
ncbi:unnamed protein product, partial [Eretmochelys imbricata]